MDSNNTNSVEQINDFGIRALYLFAKHVYPKLNGQDRIIMDDLINLLLATSEGLDIVIEKNKPLFSMVYKILHPHTDLTATMTNYAGIVLGRMEDIIFPEEDALDIV